MIERIDAVDLETTVADAVEATKEEYADLNRKQWAEGVRKDGEPIEPGPYSPGYARRRLRKGLQTDVIDLRFTGALYQGYAVNVDGTVIRMGSEVEYEQYVSRRYSGIYGLTEENMEQYRRIVKPLIIQSIQAQLYG